MIYITVLYFYQTTKQQNPMVPQFLCDDQSNTCLYLIIPVAVVEKMRSEIHKFNQR